MILQKGPICQNAIVFKGGLAWGAALMVAAGAAAADPSHRLRKGFGDWRHHRALFAAIGRDMIDSSQIAGLEHVWGTCTAICSAFECSDTFLEMLRTFLLLQVVEYNADTNEASSLFHEVPIGFEMAAFTTGSMSFSIFSKVDISATEPPTREAFQQMLVGSFVFGWLMQLSISQQWPQGLFRFLLKVQESLQGGEAPPLINMWTPAQWQACLPNGIWAELLCQRSPEQRCICASMAWILR